MATESKTQIKTYFETGDVPTEAQFENLIDSAAWYDELPTVPEMQEQPAETVAIAYTRTGLQTSHPSQTTGIVGNYYGFRSEIGDIYTSARYIKFRIEAASIGEEPTQLTVSLKEGAANAAATVSRTVAIERGTVGTQQEVMVDLGTAVNLSGMVWLQVTGNGKFAPVGAPDNSAPVKGWSSTANTQGTLDTDPESVGAAWSNVGANLYSYEFWAELWVSQTVASMTPASALQAGIFDNLTVDDASDIYAAISGLLPANNGIEVHGTPLAGPLAAAGASVASGTWIRINSASEGLIPGMLFYYE